MNTYDELFEQMDISKCMTDNFKEIAKEAASNGLDGYAYFVKLNKFYHDNCEACGTQRCLGVYDKEWREGCPLYRKEFCENSENTQTTITSEEIPKLISKPKYVVTKKVVYCEKRCTRLNGTTIFDCLECKERVGEISEKTETLTQEQYIRMLKDGNVFITKVETIE